MQIYYIRISSLQKVLKRCIRGTFWKNVLEECFGRMFWKDVLRVSGNNPLDLLYNSNKPSNTIRPGGLGGTPIKKNHPKRKKLCFYPPEISYLRPLYYYLVRLAPS
jgi:hypothetical protein